MIVMSWELAIGK